MDDWARAVLDERRWREGHYLGADTPLSPESRAAFGGLRWFDLDASWRFRAVRLERHATPRPAALPSTGDDAVAMLEVGALRFEREGRAMGLLAYEPAPGESDERYVLVPFRDATSGKETYGGGRYLDLEPRDDDAYELDFNRAYHPYCAHDDAWSCTLPPRENTLPVRVEAGERL